MKQMAMTVLVVLIGALSGCGGGGSSSANTVTGNWTANLTDASGTQAFAFTTSLMQSGTVVSGTNLTFTTSTSCFTSGGSQTGSFVLSGNFNGNMTGAFQLTITSGTPPGNTLALMGTVNNNTVTGTWTLTGTGGCTGSGNFTLTKM